MLGGHVCAKEGVSLVGKCLGAPNFEGIIEQTSAVDVVVAEAKELGIGDGFISVGGEFMAIAKLEEKILDGGGGIPFGGHDGVVGGEVLGSDVSVFGPEVLEDLKGIATTKFGDGVLKGGEVFVGATVGDHRNKNDFDFIAGGVILA